MMAGNLVSSEYGNKIKTLARVRNLAYSASQMVQQKINGFGQIINPEMKPQKKLFALWNKGR